MPRNMSFALTEKQYLDGCKDVTRRLGWADLKPGEIFNGVRKGMGLKKGEKIVKLGPSVCISNWAERVDAIAPIEVRREGFPDWTREQFIEFFCEANDCAPDKIINRIEFRRIDAVFKIGDCVTLKPSHWWLSKYQPLAKTERPGTIISMGAGKTHIVFDAIKAGAQQIEGAFALEDIKLCNRKPAQPKQEVLL